MMGVCLHNQIDMGRMWYRRGYGKGDPLQLPAQIRSVSSRLREKRSSPTAHANTWQCRQGYGEGNNPEKDCFSLEVPTGCCCCWKTDEPLASRENPVGC